MFRFFSSNPQFRNPTRNLARALALGAIGCGAAIASSSSVDDCRPLPLLFPIPTVSLSNPLHQFLSQQWHPAGLKYSWLVQKFSPFFLFIWRRISSLFFYLFIWANSFRSLSIEFLRTQSNFIWSRKEGSFWRKGGWFRVRPWLFGPECNSQGCSSRWPGCRQYFGYSWCITIEFWTV